MIATIRIIEVISCLEGKELIFIISILVRHFQLHRRHLLNAVCFAWTIPISFVEILICVILSRRSTRILQVELLQLIDYLSIHMHAFERHIDQCVLLGFTLLLTQQDVHAVEEDAFQWPHGNLKIHNDWPRFEVCCINGEINPIVKQLFANMQLLRPYRCKCFGILCQLLIYLQV